MNQKQSANLVSSLYDGWYVSLVSYATRVCRQRALAEEAVQESFMRLHRELIAGKQISNPKAWTFCVVRHEVSRLVKPMLGGEANLSEAEWEGIAALDEWSDPEAGIQRDELSRLMVCLTSREEEVLLLRMESMKYREIAAHLGITSSSVNTLLIRALQKLKSAIRTDPCSEAPAAKGKNATRTLH